MQVSAANRVGEAQPLEPCSLQQAVSAPFTAVNKKKTVMICGVILVKKQL